MAVIALVTDLIFGTKIASTAVSLGVELHKVRTLEALNSKLSGGGATLLLVDLNANGVDPIAAIRAVKQWPAGPTIVAYLSHVQTDLAAAATAAGADMVMPRSAFSAKLPEILQSAHGEKPA